MLKFAAWKERGICEQIRKRLLFNRSCSLYLAKADHGVVVANVVKLQSNPCRQIRVTTTPERKGSGAKRQKWTRSSRRYQGSGYIRSKTRTLSSEAPETTQILKPKAIYDRFLGNGYFTWRNVSHCNLATWFLSGTLSVLVLIHLKL